MSNRVNSSAQMSAECREMLSQKLNVPLDTAFALNQLSATLKAGEAGLPDLRQVIGAPTVKAALTALAPDPLSRAHDLLTGTPGLAVPSGPLLGEVRAALMEAVAGARATIADAARDITADAFIAAGQDLGYTSRPYRGSTVTGIELRREHELILMLVHDDGTVQADHAGLSDAACGSRQRELERAARHHGITLTNRRELYHGQALGSELIRSAAARRDPMLARAAVLEAEGPPPRVVTRRLFETGRTAEERQRSRLARRGGAA